MGKRFLFAITFVSIIAAISVAGYLYFAKQPSALAAGNIINAASCEQADVQAAINSASDGDTVAVPAGTCTWTSNLGITKSVILVGSGVDSTIIINGGASYIITIIPAAPADNPAVRVSGFTFDGIGGSCMLIRNENTTYDFTNFRIYGNKFQNVVTSKEAIYTRGMVFGLIDGNTFINNYYDLNIRGYDWHSWDKYTKDTDNTLVYDSLGMGGARFLYVENNTFYNSRQFHVSSGEGARWVFRYNDLHGDTGPAGFLDMHGDTNNDGNVAVEAYNNNQITSAGTAKYSSSMWADYRGGTAMIHNNSVYVDTGGIRTQIKVREETSPCSKLRRGYDMRIHNGYIWNNKNSKNNSPIYIHHNLGLGADYDLGDCLSFGVDYWSDTNDQTITASSYFATGLSSARPAACSATIPADVYWETDTKNLYRCTAIDTWTFIYEPYTYPHPLTVVEAPPPLKGDFNSDSKVNNLDFTSFKNAFKGIFNSIFDLNSDNAIDVKDLGVLMNSWQS